MQPRTDLAMEAKALYERSAQEQTQLSGVAAREQERHGVRMTVVKITSAEGEQALGKPRGTYITAELEALSRREPGSFSNAVRTVSRALRELLGPCRQALVVGLGNRDITPDAIGPEAVKNLIVTRHLQAGPDEALPGLMRVAACQPGVLGQTGIESLELVKCAMQTAQPDVVIVIDALAAAEPGRLFRTVQLSDSGIVPATKGRHAIYCLTVIGTIEGHSLAPDNQKSTKYEHVIPQLVDIEEDPAIEGLLVILNTVGGDVEAGLALAELISGVSKPSATLVLGGGHSIGIPLAVSARKSFIVPTATMTVHPVRHSGMVLGVPQTLRYFEQMQERIVSFVAGHSGISAKRFTQLMHNTGELVMDMGTVLGGEQAVEEGLIDAIGNLGDALRYLYAEIDAGKTGY